MKIFSPAIQNNQIDLRYGKFGQDFIGSMPSLSLPLEITEAPAGTKSYALILDDKMAVCGRWMHWLAANIKVSSIPAGLSGSTPAVVEGRNGWGKNQYGGMAPPDKPHRYDLTVYALDTILPLKAGFSEDELLSAMAGHILATATLSGIYPS